MNAADLVPALYAQTGYWHGTGRYRYDENGRIFDILAGIMKDGGLLPHEDDWDKKRGRVTTISLARSRMYARWYACMHLPNGQRLRNEYRSRYLWAYYFFGTTRLIAMIEYGFKPYVPGYEEKLRRWSRKMSKRERSAHGIFLQGTDITNNYPILIGVQQGAIRCVSGSRFFDLHEARSESPIAFGAMTHLEVPEANIAETTALIRKAGHALPVVPMEAGEDYCRTFSFWKLVSGMPLVH